MLCGCQPRRKTPVEVAVAWFDQKGVYSDEDEGLDAIQVLKKIHRDQIFVREMTVQLGLKDGQAAQLQRKLDEYKPPAPVTRIGSQGSLLNNQL